MSKYTTRVQCAFEGCGECGHYGHSSRREQAEFRKKRFGKPWYCTRHTNPERTLMPDNLERESVIESYLYEGPHGSWPTWTTGSAFAHGENWKAWAKDFPIGTKIVVSVKVILPEGGDHE